MKGIRIISKRDGFRRAGIEHHGTQEYPRDKFTEDEIKALKAESLLVVQDIDLPDPEPDKAKGGKKAGPETPAS